MIDAPSVAREISIQTVLKHFDADENPPREAGNVFPEPQARAQPTKRKMRKFALISKSESSQKTEARKIEEDSRHLGGIMVARDCKRNQHPDVTMPRCDVHDSEALSRSRRSYPRIQSSRNE
jgi:hypothetical protein